MNWDLGKTNTTKWDLGKIWARKCNLHPPAPVPTSKNPVNISILGTRRTVNNTLFFPAELKLFPYQPNPFAVVKYVNIANGIDCTLTFRNVFVGFRAAVKRSKHL